MRTFLSTIAFSISGSFTDYHRVAQSVRLNLIERGRRP